jgi:hypothetical protein
MDNETIMTLGMFSKDMLGDQRFKALRELFGQQLAVDMLNTQPHETKKREGLHAAYVGFNEFMALISKFAEAFDTLAKQTQLDNFPAQNEYE